MFSGCSTTSLRRPDAGGRRRSPLSFVLRTVCLYTRWAGHLARRIRMLTSLLHSAHSFWNDSIFLILFGFRVCALRQCGILFQSRILLRTFAYLNFVLKFRTGSARRPQWKKKKKKKPNREATAVRPRGLMYVWCVEIATCFLPPIPRPPHPHLLRNAKFPLDVNGIVCCSSSVT